MEIWASDVKIRSVQNFENYYFFVPDDVVNQADKYMLRVGTPVYLSGTNVGMAVQNGVVLNIGDTINLIDKTEGTPDKVMLGGKEFKGGTLFTDYDFVLELSGNSLVAIADRKALGGGRLPAGKAKPETKSLVEGQVASVALLSEGNELATGQALTDAKTAASAAAAEGKNWAVFATLGGGKSRYDTGSHVIVKSIDFVTGLAKEFSGSKGDLLLGVFFETGHGNYSTHNSFDNNVLVDGDGKAHYYGGGLMLHLEAPEEKVLYFQAIGRIGGMNNNWGTDDLKEKVSYDTRHLYFGATAGVGHQGNIGKYIGYDIYGKFMWNHQNGDDVDVNGEKIQFHDIDSVKTRIGLRVDYEGGKVVRPFLGLAWDREFNGEANAKVNGYRIDAPTLNGSTGLLELGISCRPGSKSNWQLDFAATGYIGVRRGLRGSAHFVCNF